MPGRLQAPRVHVRAEGKPGDPLGFPIYFGGRQPFRPGQGGIEIQHDQRWLALLHEIQELRNRLVRIQRFKLETGGLGCGLHAGNEKEIGDEGEDHLVIIAIALTGTCLRLVHA